MSSPTGPLFLRPLPRKYFLLAEKDMKINLKIILSCPALLTIPPKIWNYYGI
jgi:hypothetical protein